MVSLILHFQDFFVANVHPQFEKLGYPPPSSLLRSRGQEYLAFRIGERYGPLIASFGNGISTGRPTSLSRNHAFANSNIISDSPNRLGYRGSTNRFGNVFAIQNYLVLENLNLNQTSHIRDVLKSPQVQFFSKTGERDATIHGTCIEKTEPDFTRKSFGHRAFP